MFLNKSKKSKEKIGKKPETCPHCGAPLKGGKAPKPKKWHERTSVTLCIAAGLIIVGFGFIHVITGVTSPYNLSFDIVFKESFGYRETFINAGKIQALPYTAAKIKYPISCKALQSRGYLESGSVFETRVTRQLRENMKTWQAQFERSLNKPELQWQDKLLGQTPDVGLDPEDPNACNNRGIALAKEGRYETAIARFTKAFQRNPVFAEAYYNRGLVDLEIGQLGQAISDITKAVEIKSQLTECYSIRGGIYVSMDQYEQAISDFSKVIELDPDSTETYFRRSLACYANGQYEQAWQDVYKIQDLGLPVPSGFLTLLRASSGKSR
ncbi:MAG: tetratricopeptide repeat protein [Planctomycetota bacterium]|jgi:tetratricopeptide (TPR) repeat protein